MEIPMDRSKIFTLYRQMKSQPSQGQLCKVVSNTEHATTTRFDLAYMLPILDWHVFSYTERA